MTQEGTRDLKVSSYNIMNSIGDGRLQKWFAVGLSALIVSNILGLMLETVEAYQKAWGNFFFGLEVFSVAVFTVEYILRLWNCDVNPKYRGFKGRIRFFFSPLALVDLLAILPSLLIFSGVDFRFLRLARIFRLVRAFKLMRYSESLKTLGNVFKLKAPEIGIALSLGATLLVGSSSLMYFVENHAQPENFSSIPATMWWSVVTLTTVGYGDIHPITPLGKFFGAFIAVLGVGMFALPAGIIASGFAETIQSSKNAKTGSCHACGRPHQQKQ